MSHWNYRVFRHKSKGSNYEWLAIHECYYDDDGNENGHTMNGVSLVGDDLEELKSVHAMMREAFEKPILEYS